MPHDDFEILKFKTCRNLHGNPQRVTTGRRNGKPATFFPPSVTEPVEPSAPNAEPDQLTKFFINLTPVERQTWLKILRAQSIASIAKEEGVSRAAIYARIQGNRKGQGGMVGKNFWVLLWWRLRRRNGIRTDCRRNKP